MVIYFNVSVMWNRAYHKEQITQGNNITQKKLNVKEAVQMAVFTLKAGINVQTGILEGRPLKGNFLLNPGFSLISIS